MARMVGVLFKGICWLFRVTCGWELNWRLSEVSRVTDDFLGEAVIQLRESHSSNFVR